MRTFKKFSAIFILSWLMCAFFVSLAMAESIEINKTNFPDEVFREYVGNNCDSNGDGWLSPSEIIDVTYITFMSGNTITSGDEIIDVGAGVKSLKGIEFFYNLETLTCNGSNWSGYSDTLDSVSERYHDDGLPRLTELDVTNNRNLTSLTCEFQRLSNLSVSYNTKLEVLSCRGNMLTNINVSNNKALKYFECDSNLLTEIDVSKNTNLEYLSCAGNYLTQLDLSKNQKLGADDSMFPWDSYMALSQMYAKLKVHKANDGSYYADLKDYLSDKISKVNPDTVQISYDGMLEPAQYDSNTGIIQCTSSPQTVTYQYDTGITQYGQKVYMEVNLTRPSTDFPIDDSYFPHEKFREYVEKFDTDNDGWFSEEEISKVTSINVSNMQSNISTFLNGIEFFTNLTSLHCENNFLYSLDLSKNTKLKELFCNNCGLCELNVPENTELIYLVCSYNNLTQLDLSKNNKLTLLNCSPQSISGLKFIQSDDKLYHANLKDYLSNNIDKIKVEGLQDYDSNLAEYNSTTGTAKFFHIPESVIYKYDTGCQANLSEAKLMSVELTPSNFPDVVTKYLSDGKVEKSYEEYIEGTGSNLIWTCSGDLPDGLSLDQNPSALSNRNVARIKGTPTDSAVSSTFKIIASNDYGIDSKDFTITIISKPQINGTLENGVTKAPYNNVLKIVGGTSPYVWEIIDGILPDGLELSPDITGAELTIRGTPTTAQTCNFTLKITDDNNLVASKDFTVTITKPKISGSLKNTCIKNKTYSSTIKVSGGTAPYTWIKSSGTLPKGLELSPDITGEKLTLKGIPTSAKDYTFKLKVTDKNGAYVSKSYTITITQPTINGALKETCVKNKTYSSKLTVSGGTSPYTWVKSSGTLPADLELVPNTTGTTLTIKGTPLTAKTYTFKLKVTDKNGLTASKSYTVMITQPTIAGTLKETCIKNKTYSSKLTVSGGTSPYTWVKSSGTLPAGLELVPNTTGTTLTIKGTPSTAKTYTFKLKVTDKNGLTASKSYTVTITQPTISGSLKTSCVKDSSYSSSLKVSGGTSPYTWEKISGTLPEGLELVPNAKGTTLTIKGIPSTVKAYTFKLKVTDKNGLCASKQYKVTITKPTSEAASKSVSTEKFAGIKDNDNVSQEISLPLDEQNINENLAVDAVNNVCVSTELNILSDDILWRGIGKDEDLVGVRENQPVTFFITAPVEILSSDVKVFIDDILAEDLTVYDENSFTVPSELVNDDFKVQVKILSQENELESNELYISVERN